MTSLLSEEEKNRIKEIKENIEDYTSTIIAAQTFISIVTWNDGSIINGVHYSVGRSMTTTEHNKIIKNTKVTPDIVIEINPTLGYVVEIKKSLPNNVLYWEEIFKQLLKYDDDLLGWWNPEEKCIENPITVALMHQSRVVRFIDNLSEYLINHNYQFDKRFCVIGFNRSDEVQQYYFHQIRYGSFLPDHIENRLRDGIEVPVEKIFKSFPQLKFFDCEPTEVEYTMGILWQDIFNSSERGEYNKDLKGNPISVNINQLTEMLQEFYGNKSGDGVRNNEFPQKPWIKEALDSFVKIGLAKKVDEDNYIIIFKLIKTDVHEYFGRKLMKAPEQVQAEQPQLF